MQVPKSKIALVGEAFGKEEAERSATIGKPCPFIGAAGQELTRMLRDIGLAREETFITNTFNLRPEGNDITTLCCSKKDLMKAHSLPPLRAGKYLRPEYIPELKRLQKELSAGFNIAIALGATATWALLGVRPDCLSGTTTKPIKIGSVRGYVYESSLVPGLKVIPVYHPAAILRNWPWRTIALADLMKALRESKSPELEMRSRDIWIMPTLHDLTAFEQTHIQGASRLVFDIETTDKQISCIGFSPNESTALCVPFIQPDGTSYWKSTEAEVAAWEWCRALLEGPLPKIAQNGLFDIQWLWTRMGIKIYNFRHDTMLLHHSLFPEMPKGLGFLGSIYTNTPEWKSVRTGNTLKNDD